MLEVLASCRPRRWSVLAVLVLGLAGCSDHALWGLGDRSEAEEESETTDEDGELAEGEEDESDQEEGDEASDEDEEGVEEEDGEDDGGDEPSDPPQDDADPPQEAPEPGSSSSNPRGAAPGDLVINELMVDPSEEIDGQAEYVELLNDSEDWIDASGLRLADDGVDDAPLVACYTGALKVPPGGFLVACADDRFTHNGGISCQATFHYQTFGGGFALSNTEDEVILRTDSGLELDRVSYTTEQIDVGSARGVDPDFATVQGNDVFGHWCDQWGWLPFGDSGTPGEGNEDC